MAPLPTPGASDGTYGTELNAYLVVEHETDGTHGDTVPTSVTSSGDITSSTFFKLGPDTELTIAGGIITATGSLHTVDTQSNDPSDELDTVNGAAGGNLLVLRPADATRTIVAKDGTGNLRLAGDFTMDHSSDMLFLVGVGANWIEISRSSNET